MGLPTQRKEGNAEKNREKTEIAVSGSVSRFYNDCAVLEYTGRFIACMF